MHINNSPLLLNWPTGLPAHWPSSLRVCKDLPAYRRQSRIRCWSVHIVC